MDTDEAVEEGYSFTLWLRTGRLVRVDALGAREVKFNPNHDPKDGRFTVGSGASSAGMSRRPKPVAPRVAGKTWNGGGFTGGGGGSAGGGGATGYYMTDDERQAYQRQHPGRDPYLAQPGDTVASIAAAHGLTVDQVRGLNGIAAGARIDPGRVLALPSGALQQVEKNGYAFGIDPADRTRTVGGDLYLADEPKRSTTNQKRAGGVDRRATDDGGHFIAARFGGPMDSFNHFAQDANFNRGEYRAVEDGWARDVRSGKHVHVDIVAHYSGASRRPDSLAVRTTINGRSRTKSFGNEPKGHTRGR